MATSPLEAVTRDSTLLENAAVKETSSVVCPSWLGRLELDTRHEGRPLKFPRDCLGFACYGDRCMRCPCVWHTSSPYFRSPQEDQMNLIRQLNADAVCCYQNKLDDFDILDSSLKLVSTFNNMHHANLLSATIGHFYEDRHIHLIITTFFTTHDGCKKTKVSVKQN